MTLTAPYRSELPVGRDGFPQLVHAEWTKLRTVRGWVLGLVSSAVLTVLFGLISVAGGGHVGCGGGGCGTQPIGPGGEPVTDAFFFVHQPLAGDGSITVRVAPLTGTLAGAPPNGGGPAAQEGADGVVPWAKAGVIIKQSLAQGSPYAAVMLTGSHGVRMQTDFTQDKAGAGSSAVPRWLRLTRSGAQLTGFESADGAHWTTVGSVLLPGLSGTAQVGLFVTSPDLDTTSQGLKGVSSSGGPTTATAGFDHVALQGADAGSWSGQQVGGTTGGPGTTDWKHSGDSITITGAGDIAPAVAGPDPDTVERTLVGVFAGLVVLVVLASLFVTTEYRRGLIRTTLAATPRRGAVLAAKAVVISAAAFAVGLAGSVAAFVLVGHIRHSHGDHVLAVSTLTEVRVVVGTAALIAVSSVLALAVGVILRRSAAAAATVIVLIVAPWILSVSVLPIGVAQWLLRITPAAGFAIQQSTRAYAQVDASYIPATGFYPLAPWAGFAVLCGWTLAVLGLALVLFRRRDA